MQNDKMRNDEWKISFLSKLCAAQKPDRQKCLAYCSFNNWLAMMIF